MKTIARPRRAGILAGVMGLVLMSCGDDDLDDSAASTEAGDRPTATADDGDDAETNAADAGETTAAEDSETPAVDETDETHETDEANVASPDDVGDAIPIEAQTIGASVHYGGLEYSVIEMAVNDLDAEMSPDGQVDQRMMGVELVFDVQAVNPHSDTLTPRVPVTLRWDEPGTDNVVEVNGRSDFRQVPGGSSGSGEIVVPVGPAELELFDDASARLMFGQGGESTAQVPVGAEAELVDRFPVPQPDLVGSTFEHDGVTVTITAADIRWNLGTTQVEEGAVLLEIGVELQNDTDGQQCWNRGTGNNFALVTADGAGYADEQMSDRGCTSSGASTESLTGFFLDEDYSGEYTMRNDTDLGSDEIAVTLTDGAGVPDSER